MSLTNDKFLLAVARENRAIEIWKVDTFAQILIVPGHKNVDIRNLHWIEPDQAEMNKRDVQTPQNILYYNRHKNNKTTEKKRRLITTGVNGMVIEWDLLSGKPKSTYQASGAIYDSKVLGKFVYIACEDGSIRVIKIRKKKIELVKMFVKSDAACLSIDILEKQNNEVYK